jgi:TRAP-type mannitol/chloroaromatic compound transport system substrate-binding protein
LEHVQLLLDLANSLALAHHTRDRVNLQSTANCLTHRPIAFYTALAHILNPTGEQIMDRRHFVTHASVAGATTALVAAPALAQNANLPEVRWRIASSYPKSLITIYGAMELFCKRVGELTAGKFNINLHAAGELAPALQVLDAAQSGSVEAGHSASYFFIGKDPAFGFGTALPFGLNSRGQNAWMYDGNGEKLLSDFYDSYGVVHLPVSNTGAQMAGWYRKEIKSVEDLKGLKFRVGGLAGMVLSKLGVVPQQIAPGDLYTALEKGVLDAAEFVGPVDDERLGLHKVARYYYYPGWWEGAAHLSLFINKKAWSALPATYQTALRSAAYEATAWSLAKYDTANPAALRRLVAGGALLRSFPKSVSEACFKAANELYSELSDKSPAFKTIYADWVKFRDEQVVWQRFCEMPFDTLMSSLTRSK